MFGIDVIDASLLPALFVAVLTGLISFISPCVLPIVPPYLAYMGGISMSEMTDESRSNRPVVLAAVFFALGLSTVFVLLGFAFSLLGQFVAEFQDYLRWGAGTVIILFGLHFLHVITIPFLQRDARIDVGDKGGSAFGAYLLGLAFAFGWSPCLGPLLGTILGLAAEEGQVVRGSILLAGYAFGLGIPFVLAAVFINRAMSVMNRLKRHMKTIEIFMGVLLLIVGVALITNSMSQFSFWLLEMFPSLASIG